MCRHALIPLVVFLAALVDTNHAAGLKWLREIESPDMVAPTLVAVPLDIHFYENTREGWPDVRLINAQGEPQGYLIRKVSDSKSRVVRSFWTAEQLSAKVISDRELIVEFALREKEPIPSGIRIVTPLRDFERQVRVEASDDGTTWESAGHPSPIFDYTRYVNARNDLAPITAGNHRRFRLIVNDLTAELESQLLELHRRSKGGDETDRTESTRIDRRPFRVDHIEFYREETRMNPGEVKHETYPVKHFQVIEVAGQQQTHVTITSQRQPVDQVKILCDNQNFSRQAWVEFEDPNEGHRGILKSSGQLTRFSIGTLEKDETSVDVKESRANQFKVIIENRDSPPLKITGIELIGPRYELIYLSSPDTSCHLEYGSADMEAGRFDTGALDAALAQNQPTVGGTLKPASDNPHASKAGKPWKPWNDPRFLAMIMLVLAALLGWGLFRASLKITPPAAGE